MTRVLVLGDEKKGGSQELVTDFTDWLGQRVDDVRVILDRDSSLENEPADFVVVFGGDGSILAAARRMGRSQKPTFGVNVGRLGFLTACGPENARKVAELALAGKLIEEPRLMLEGHVETPDGSRGAPVTALNDGVLSRNADGGILTIAASRGGREIATYAGDGLIVSTPTGSTAYSLAAGGPVLAPEMEAVVLTPLASHSLALRPLVVPLEDGIELRVQDDAGGTGRATLILDGQVPMQVRVGDCVCLRPAPVRFRHLNLAEDSFFRVFREKLGWGDLPR